MVSTVEDQRARPTAPRVRSLTVAPPWPLAIVRGWKPVENRVQNLAGEWRGRVLILTSANKWYADAAKWIAEQLGIPPIRREECHPGHYIGAATLVDVHEAAGCCQPWGEEPATPDQIIWHHVFTEPVEFKEPIKAVGHLGLRYVEDRALVRAALEGVPPA